MPVAVASALVKVRTWLTLLTHALQMLNSEINKLPFFYVLLLHSC